MPIVESETYKRMVKKVGGSLGYCDSEYPAVLDTWEIIGKPFKKNTKVGVRTVYPKARAVLLSDGSLDIIEGGTNATVSEKDARRILGTKLDKKLSKSLKVKTSVK
jgi:hypothetical protein